MDLGKTIAALPWLRRLWRVLPGPLKLPLLVVAAVVWWKRRGSSDDELGSDAQDASGDEEAERPGADGPEA